MMRGKLSSTTIAPIFSVFRLSASANVAIWLLVTLNSVVWAESDANVANVAVIAENISNAGKTLQDKILSLESKYQTVIHNLSTELEDTKNQSSSLIADIRRLEEACRVMEQNAAEAAKTRLEQESFQEKELRLKTKIEELIEEKALSQEENRTLGNEIRTLKAEIELSDERFSEKLKKLETTRNEEARAFLEKIATLESSGKELKRDIENKNETIASFDRQLQAVNAELEGLRKLKAGWESQRGREEELANENIKLKAYAGGLKEEVEEKDGIISAFDKQLQALMAETKELKNLKQGKDGQGSRRVEALEGEIAGLKNSVKMLKEEIVNKDKLLVTYNQRTTDLLSQITEFQDKNQKREEAYAREMSLRGKEVARLDRYSRELEKDLQKKDKTIASLDRQTVEMGAKVKELQDLSRSRTEEISRLKELENNVSFLKASEQKLKDEIADKDKLLTSYNEKTKEMISQINVFQSANRDQEKSHENAIEALSKEIASLKADKKNLFERVQNGANQIDAANLKLKETQNKIRELERHSKTLETEYKNRLDAIQKESVALLKESNVEIAKLERRNKEMENRIEFVAKEYQQKKIVLEDNIAALNQQNQEKIAKWQSEYNNLLRENHELKQTLSYYKLESERIMLLEELLRGIREDVKMKKQREHGKINDFIDEVIGHAEKI